jgi:hypothetical protein
VTSRSAEILRFKQQGPQMQRLNDSRIVCFVIAAHLVLTVTLAYFVTIDVDETFTLATTSHGPVHAVERAISFELQPPLYFGVLSLWRAADDSVFHARLFSVLCVALALVVLARFVRRFLPDLTAGLVVAPAAFSPMIIYAAIEARCYAMVILLSALLVSLFASGFMVTAPRLRSRLAFAVAAVASLYTFYFLGFMIAAGGVILVAAKRWRTACHYFLTLVGVAICFAPLAVLVNGQLESHTTMVTTAPGLFETLRSVSWQLRSMVLPVDWEPLEQIAKAGWLVLAGAICFSLSRNWREFVDRSKLAVLCGYLAIVACYVAVVQILGGNLLGERHFSLLLIPTILAVSYCVFIAGGRRAMQCAVLLVMPFMLASLPVRYPHGAKAGDWQRVAELVMQHEKEQQPVVIFTPAAARALQHYYAGKNQLVPLPQAQSSDRYAPQDFQLHSPEAVSDCVSDASPDHKTLWLVLDSERVDDVGFGIEHLKAYIDRQYDVEARFTLHGSTLLKCNRKAEPLKHRLSVQTETAVFRGRQKERPIIK